MVELLVRVVTGGWIDPDWVLDAWPAKTGRARARPALAAASPEMKLRRDVIGKLLTKVDRKTN
jgi:hypothetical protein